MALFCCLSYALLLSRVCSQDMATKCGTKNCRSSIIDGRIAQSLTINCSSPNSCYNTTIHCPAGSCNIFCSTSGSCNQTIIYANTSDLSLQASDHGMFVFPSVYVTLLRETFTTTQKGAWRGSLFGSIANSINVYCTSTNFKTACNGKWYLPNYAHNVKFSCYLHGCQDLGDFYVTTSIKYMTTKFYGCGVYDEVQGCLNDYGNKDIAMIHCGALNGWDGIDCGKYPYGQNCDCAEMASNYQFVSWYSERCPHKYTTTSTPSGPRHKFQFTQTMEYVMIGSIVGICTICICVGLCVAGNSGKGGSGFSVKILSINYVRINQN